MTGAVRLHRLPVFWLGVVVFGLSMAGAVATIVLAARYSDEPLPVTGERLLKVPAELPSTPPPQPVPHSERDAGKT